MLYFLVLAKFMWIFIMLRIRTSNSALVKYCGWLVLVVGAYVIKNGNKFINYALHFRR